MSASNKKKLRKEQEAAKLTEKQLAAQKEAKKTNLYTIGFVILMAVILVAAIVVGINQTITSRGVREKNTVALTVGEHSISNAELNYFYMDAVNTFSSQYGSYAALFGLDTTKPLDEQVQDPDSGATWADYFLTSAQQNARSTYAMSDAAKEAGYTLPEDAQSAIDTAIGNLRAYATLNGFSSDEQYVKALFGRGSSVDSYRAYLELTSLASSYYSQYGQDLSYTDADLREKEAENPAAYNSYSFNAYYLAASRFLTGGTTDADGKTTYSDEEKAASVLAAEVAAKSLTVDVETLEDLDAAIAALDVNQDTEAASSAYADVLYGNVSSVYSQWVTDASRKAGDMTVIPNTSTSTAEDGTETTVTNGYYVLFFNGSTDNKFPLVNVRHILVSFQGGTQDPNTGATNYSDEEKAAAKATAEELLEKWKAGDKTEDSFAALANEHSSDGDGTTGGLYENVYPGQMVESFNDWCFDASRKSGDTGIVESQYGYHVMYFVGNADITYRDYQIQEELRAADLESWYTGLVDAMPLIEGNTGYIRKDLVLNANG